MREHNALSVIYFHKRRATDMLASTYLRDAAWLVQSPISVRAMPDGSFTITQKVAGLRWECSDAETARAIYKQVRRNYLSLFRTQDYGDAA